MIKKFHAEFHSIVNAFQTFLRRLFGKKSRQFLQWRLGVSFFFQGSLKEKQSPESLIVRENRWIFLCDMSAWEIWCEENSGPLNKIFKLKPAPFIEMILVCRDWTSQAWHKLCAEISALAVEVLHLHLRQVFNFFLFAAIEKSSYIHYGILRKTKEFASETAWHIVIVEIWLPMGYSPRWKKKFKKIKININVCLVKNFLASNIKLVTSQLD